MTRSRSPAEERDAAGDKDTAPRRSRSRSRSAERHRDKRSPPPGRDGGRGAATTTAEIGQDYCVRGLAWATDEASMRAYFSRYGTVSLAEVKRTAEGRSRGFGFLAFSQMEDGAQERLFADNPHMLDGRSVDVLPPRPEGAPRGPPRDSSRGGGGAPPMGGGGGGGGQNAPFRGGARDGDWFCGSCGNDNFSWRQECKQCGCPKTAGGVPAHQMAAPRWDGGGGHGGMMMPQHGGPPMHPGWGGDPSGGHGGGWGMPPAGGWGPWAAAAGPWAGWGGGWGDWSAWGAPPGGDWGDGDRKGGRDDRGRR